MSTKRELHWEIIPTPRQPDKSPEPDDIPPKPHDADRKLSKADLMFIKDLNPTDKAKIAVLIQQIVKLEQNNAELIDSYEKLKSKFERKNSLYTELEDYAERMRTQNETLISENRATTRMLSEYSSKLESANKLLKQSSDTNKKLQRKRNTKGKDEQVQTDIPHPTKHNRSLQTSLLPEPEPKPDSIFKDSMSVFLDKLDTICEKLSAVDTHADKPSDKLNASLVHNHKRDGYLVTPTPLKPDLVYNADSDHGQDIGLDTHKIKDSILVVRDKKLGRYNRNLLSIIKDIENDENDEDILQDLFFRNIS